MRCLTIAEELHARGHEVTLWGSLGGVPWLGERVTATGVRHLASEPFSLDVDVIAAEADVVVVDSYTIDPAEIGRLDALAPVLAVIDGDDRRIRASAYLDQNLHAEALPYPSHVSDRLYAGSRYALVRRELSELHRVSAWPLPDEPRVLCVLGGSDPLRSMPRVAAALCTLPEEVRLTLVTAPESLQDVRELVAGRGGVKVVPPTSHIAGLLAESDLVVSAAGTTAWDVCTIGMPAVFIAVVDNQRAGLRAILDAGVALGLDATHDVACIDTVGQLVAMLIDDEDLRNEQSARCRELFDGRGPERVADALELMSEKP
nr:glycosyltransferase [Microbacterium ulmi]